MKVFKEKLIRILYTVLKIEGNGEKGEGEEEQIMRQRGEEQPKTSENAVRKRVNQNANL